MLVSDDFLAEIGRVAVLQDEIGASLGALVGTLMGVDGAASDALTATLGFRALSQLAESLLLLRRDRLGDLQTIAVELVQRAVQAEKKRNQVVHSMWSYSLDVGSATPIKPGGAPPRLESHPVSLADLQKVVAEMTDIAGALMIARTPIGSALRLLDSREERS